MSFEPAFGLLWLSWTMGSKASMTFFLNNDSLNSIEFKRPSGLVSLALGQFHLPWIFSYKVEADSKSKLFWTSWIGSGSYDNRRKDGRTDKAVSWSKTHLFPSLLSEELDKSNSPSTTDKVVILASEPSELTPLMQ